MKMMSSDMSQKILVPAFLLLSLHCYCQKESDLQEYLKNKFLLYTQNVPREELFVHTDRQVYVAGEILWFSIYLVDRMSPMPGSKIAYFELINSANRPVARKSIYIKNSIGQGQVSLPDTLSSGNYTLRAYTSWMKNFLPENCFIKDISIYNISGRKSFMKRVSSERKVTNDEKDRDIRHVTLEIKRSMQSIGIQIETSETFQEKNDMLYVFIQTRGIVNHVSAEKLTSGYITLVIPTNELIPGINQITVFDSKGKPCAEKYIYTPDSAKRTITVESDEGYGKRQKVILQIHSPGSPSSTTLRHMSVSVAPVETNKDEPVISDYMLFGTEFGLLPDQLRNPDKLNVALIDSMLLTVKSNWIDWNRILDYNNSALRYSMESNSHYLCGRVLLSGSDTSSLAGRRVLMCSPGKQAAFQYACTDTTGRFTFSLGINNVSGDFVLMPEENIPGQKIILDSPFSDMFSSSNKELYHSYDSLALSTIVFNYQVNRSYQISALGQLCNLIPDQPKQFSFYGKPDIELNLSEYITLPTMGEVFYEILPDVTLRKKGSDYKILIIDRINDTRKVLSPVLLIDGVVIRDPGMIADLEPDSISDIEVVKDNYYVGRYHFPGLINVITKAADFSAVSLPEYMIRFPYRAIDPVYSFTSPDHSSMENIHFPDFRNTLYWNPSVSLKGEDTVVLEFWSGDVSDTYKVTINGIDNNGNPVSVKKMIKVK